MKKSLLILLAIIVLGGLGGLIWYAQHEAHQKTVELLPADQVVSTPTSTTNTGPTENTGVLDQPDIATSHPGTVFDITKTTPTSTLLSQSYLQAKFRVLHIFTSSSLDYYLVIANDRTEQVGNENLCGSIYSPDSCYFFLEPKYVADAPPSQYLGVLGNHPGAIDYDSLKVIAPNIIEFVTGDGDAGVGFSKTWHLDVLKKTVALVEQQNISYLD